MQHSKGWLGTLHSSCCTGFWGEELILLDVENLSAEPTALLSLAPKSNSHLSPGNRHPAWGVPRGKLDGERALGCSSDDPLTVLQCPRGRMSSSRCGYPPNCMPGALS